MKKKTVDNSDLLKEIREARKDNKELRANMDARFEELKPYIKTLDDIHGAGKVFTWFVGCLMAIGSLYLMVKQVLTTDAK